MMTDEMDADNGRDSGKDEKKKDPEAESRSKLKMRQRVALWTGIPMTMLAGLLVGYMIGIGLESVFHTENNILLAVSVMFGVAAGFKLVFEQIKKLE
ncbi:MAG TPA: AtpZ/AtpI family protein [bacterium]|nr:AtpZ/AtpI family protein [bacterium]HPI75089.1 AtpZ/AtpI family protein [bacterium]HPN93061.1 AtpZ/AtpI family protein [bacterium]